MNKLNKLVANTFSKEISEKWMSEEFQKKVKRALKKKAEKPQSSSDEGSVPVKQHTPYIQFCIAERPNIKKDYPDLSAKEITAKLGEQWNKNKAENPEVLVRKYGYIIKN
jgi:hypothetical protein